MDDARRLQPAAILLDIPVSERDDLLRQLKADRFTSKIPVIMMSVVDRPDVPDGVDAHVGKPVQHDPLVACARGARGRTRWAAVVATILLVEDTPANLALATKLLRAAGHEVLTAETAAAGIALARARLPDLVLMDLGLPDMDGWQALSEIRADRGAVAGLRVVAFTAHAMLGDRERALAAGFDDYLSKPIEFATFADRVGDLLP